MPVSQQLVAEFNQEMATTRRVLDRIPDDRFAWQPHAKSMTLGRLSTHLAELAGFGAVTLSGDGFDVATRAGSPPRTLSTRQEVLDLFDANVAKTRAALEATGDDAFAQTWTFRRGERVLFSQPRATAFRTLLVHHTIHHRGQLSVYLRLNDVAVPSIYGPTADEQ